MSCYEKNGWIYVSIKGNPQKRGYDYGYCVAARMKKVFEMMKFNCMTNYGREWSYFIELSDKYFFDIIQTDFKEFFDEMVGFTEGCCAGGTKTTVREIVAWNNMISLLDCVHPYASEKSGGTKDRCSSFIACGDYTKDGGIVLCHSNFSEFLDGQFANVVLDIKPTKGHRILLQGFVGWMWSGTDFFVTSAGIVGAESTLGGFNKFKENKYPISCRIRQCMQYGNTLDDYSTILQKGNAGDYANAWFFGNINTNEIMMIELGLKYVNVKRTTNGYFIGMNAAYDPRIRNLECANTGIDDIRRHQGARKVRLPQLMEEYKGRIDEETAKLMISDHYDVYLHRINPCSRTVCAHYELDPREFMSQESRPVPFEPRGAVDGCIITSEMAKDMRFLLRWGNSCGIPFIVSDFCEQNPQWAFMKDYLEDRPTQEWTEFSVLKRHKTRKL